MCAASVVVLTVPSPEGSLWWTLLHQELTDDACRSLFSKADKSA
jgi:hypothetical protein